MKGKEEQPPSRAQEAIMQDTTPLVAWIVRGLEGIANLTVDHLNHDTGMPPNWIDDIERITTRLKEAVDNRRKKPG